MWLCMLILYLLVKNLFIECLFINIRFIYVFRCVTLEETINNMCMFNSS